VTLVLSGFETTDAYERREATWEPDDEFETIEGATTAAQAWVSSRPHAQVEVIDLRGHQGLVRRVVTQTAVEDIT
jgi:hypothetical protein